MFKKYQGFTLVELVVVIVIVGILSIIAVPVYQGIVEKAKDTEGKALTSAIMNAQRLYYAQHGAYYPIPAWTNYNSVLGIDARANKYYTLFVAGASSNGVGWYFTAGLDGKVATDKIEYVLSLDPNTPVIVDGHKTPYVVKWKDGKSTIMNL